MQGKRILVVDDDAHIRELTADIFAKSGGQVYSASDGNEGLRQFYVHRPHLVILDILMPNLDGWQVCTQIRQLSDVPIIMLTALGQDEHTIRGLDCGAVDYVTKPFSPKVLAARARAALRQATQATESHQPISYSDEYLTIDLSQRRVLVCGELVRLTATEYRLLAYLVQNAGRVLTFRQILEKVWGWEYQDSVEYVHVYISHLRKKLEEDPKLPAYLLTEHRVGYRFEKRPTA